MGRTGRSDSSVKICVHLWRNKDLQHRSKAMKKLTLILATIAALAIAGCNTMAGVGKDVQKAGEKLEDAAKKK
jgi:predicted small secreted protein